MSAGHRGGQAGQEWESQTKIIQKPLSPDSDSYCSHSTLQTWLYSICTITLCCRKYWPSYTWGCYGTEVLSNHQRATLSMWQQQDSKPDLFLLCYLSLPWRVHQAVGGNRSELGFTCISTTLRFGWNRISRAAHILNLKFWKSIQEPMLLSSTLGDS